jgi:hypothetical protein
MKYVIDSTTLNGIADSIREKTGGSDAIDPSDMANEILSITSGSGGGTGGVGKLPEILARTATKITAEDLQGVTVLGKSAFRDCASLVEITIPKSVTKLEIYALGSCTKLERVILESSTPPTIQTTTFGSSTNIKSYFVPVGASGAYKSKTNWSKYAAKIIEGKPSDYLFVIEDFTDEPRTDLPAPVDGVSYTAFITNPTYDGAITATCEDGHIEFLDLNEPEGICYMALAYDVLAGWYIADGETLLGTVSIRING